MAVRSNALVCCGLLAGTAGSIRAYGMDICLFGVLSGRGLCFGLIASPEKSTECCVPECNLKT